ncbi:electron transfer flavoprotein alpha/ beta subunit [SAR202 cluster bacterium AD-804-J14_MRT_500m]|nr:electron transfer flavoprotein alpha/ beta subunit [SAR202 cluster bacterium AD-804-J14_MRT_500m]
MKIAVCIKQVPTLSRVEFDHDKKTIIREGVPLEVNSFDLVALGSAIDLRDAVGGEITVFTMGPPQAREALGHCLAAGADHAVLISDQAMAGSDTLATARTLAMTIQGRRFDLVLCGRNSTDSETGQVGPEIAELLDIPHVSRARKIELAANLKTLRAERVTDDGFEVMECSLPALITATEGLSEERWPKRREIQQASERAMEKVTAMDLSSDISKFGSKGSPTIVETIRLVEPHRLGEIIEISDAEIAARQVQIGLQGRSPHKALPQPQTWSRFPGQSDKSVWVLAEKSLSNIKWSTLENLGKARVLAESLKSEVVAVLMSTANDVESDTLASYGADRLITLEGPKDSHPISPSMTAALAKCISDNEPYAVLFSSSADGRDIASRISARLSLGLTGDCIDLELDDQSRLVQLKPALGGNVIAPILSKTHPYMVTIRPGLLSPIQPESISQIPVEKHEVTRQRGDGLRLLELHQETDAQGQELEQARVVLGIGMGVGETEKLPLIYEMARRINATVAATRNVTDAGWLPKQVQIGITGRAISPEIYVAVGIRGAFNHMVGLQNAGTIIAINNNPRHPISQASDFTIMGDWETYLPALINMLENALDNQ